MMKNFRDFISTGKGKALTTAGAAVLVAAVSIASVTCMTGASNARTASAVRKASPVSSDDGTFAAAAPVNTASSNLNSSTNGLHVVIGGNSNTSSAANGKTTTTNKNITTSSVQIKTKPTLKSTNYPNNPTGPKATKKPAAPTYKGYTRLDMTDFSIGNAIYASDGAGDRDSIFSNRISDSSNEPKSRMGDFVMPMDSIFYYYGTGKITLSNMINVLMKQKNTLQAVMVIIL